MNLPLGALPPWLQWALLLAFALATIVTGFRAVPQLWSFVRRIVGLVDALGELQPFLERAEPILGELREQIVNDHGHVILRNQLDRIEDTSTELTSQVTDAVARLDRVESGVAGLYKDQQNITKRLDSADRRRTRGTNQQT